MAKRDKNLITELRSGKMRGPSPGDPRQVRAQLMDDIADQIHERTVKQMEAHEVLQPQDMVVILAVACASAIRMFHKFNPALGSDMAATALRTLIKNMMVSGVRIPDLNMEGWTPPPIIQRGPDTKQ
jgi:hypothetical protein